MKKEMILSTLEEIKIVSDPFRIKILFLLNSEDVPMTVKQMAVKLEEIPSKVHYHVKELERIGVLELVETREKAGILEKYYYPAAEYFRIERSIGVQENQAEYDKVSENIIDVIKLDFIKSNKLKNSEDKGILNYGLHYLTDEEKEELAELVNKYLENKVKRADRKPYMFGYVMFRNYDKKGDGTDGNRVGD